VEDQRLERIEKKLDEMSQVIISIARMEEKMMTVFRRIEDHNTRITRVEDNVSDIEKKMGVNGQTLRFAERVFWILVAAVVTFVLRMM